MWFSRRPEFKLQLSYCVISEKKMTFDESQLPHQQNHHHKHRHCHC